MSGRRIYIRNTTPTIEKGCTVRYCMTPADVGVSDTLCAEHNHEEQARKEIQEKQKIIRRKELRVN